MNKKVTQTSENTSEIIKTSDGSENASSKVAPKISKRLRKALIRAGSAFLASLCLLAVTKFSFIDLIRGPKEADVVQDEDIGAFVKRDIFAVVGYYDEQKSGDKVTDKYALVPMGGKFVTVHFTKRYIESADAIYSETQNYIKGSLYTLDKYVVVDGTVEKLDDELSGKMYDWFSDNKQWLVDSQVIADTNDASEYLSDVVLSVDTVNSLNQTLVFIVTGLAALCLLYVIAELILMASGFYLDKPKKNKDEVCEKDTEQKDLEMEEDSSFEESSHENIETEPESINDEQITENTESADTDSGDFEKPEEK